MPVQRYVRLPPLTRQIVLIHGAIVLLEFQRFVNLISALFPDPDQV